MKRWLWYWEDTLCPTAMWDEVPGSSENFLDGVHLEIIPGSLRFEVSIYEFATEHKWAAI
jgi:hypothetical protein